MTAPVSSAPRWRRRAVLRLAAVATAATSALATPWRGLPAPVAAHNLPAGAFGSPLYSAALQAQGGVKGIFQSPNIEATAVAGKNLNHLLLVQLKNWLNSFQFSYGLDPADLHTIVATYASANLFTYNDAMWAKYRLGEAYKVIDPATNAPATRNVFRNYRFGNPSADPDNPQSVWQDTGIEVLQARGAVFLT